jgi:hypothetical protein
VTQANAVRPYRMVSAGILAGSLALFSSRIDKWMFYTLASGSTLLAIAFSSHSLASLARRFSRPSATPAAPFRNAL